MSADSAHKFKPMKAKKMAQKMHKETPAMKKPMKLEKATPNKTRS
jgi:hypothetical protein